MVLPRHPLLPLKVSFGPPLQEYSLPTEIHFLLSEKGNTWHHRKYHQAAYVVCSPMVGESYRPSLPPYINAHSVVPRMRPRAGLGTHGIESVRGSAVHTTTPTEGHLTTAAYLTGFRPFRPHN